MNEIAKISSMNRANNFHPLLQDRITKRNRKISMCANCSMLMVCPKSEEFIKDIVTKNMICDSYRELSSPNIHNSFSSYYHDAFYGIGG